MPRTPDKNLITSLDIGTSKVVAMVAEHNEHGELNVIGVGSHPSVGLKKGVIVNIDSTITAIKKAVEDAEHMADCKINTVCAGIAGSHIHSINSNGVVAIRDQEVTSLDVERVIDAAKAVAIPADQRILHILPQEFLIDNQPGIKEPVGMSGVRLEAKVHMISGSIGSAHNIVKCIHQCDIDVSDLVLEQLASSHSCLSDDEKELGACIIDIGGGTSDVAVFLEGAIQHTHVIPVAGHQVTNDISHALRTPTQYAESIKLQHGCALSHMASPDETIEVRGVANRPGKRIPMNMLTSVIESRYEELFAMVYQDLKHHNLLDSLSSGIVLTGGGSKMPGLVELAEEVFRMPVRLGAPQNFKGMGEVLKTPIHATGVGLLMYSQQQQKESAYELSYNVDEAGLFKRMKNWFSRHF